MGLWTWIGCAAVGFGCLVGALWWLQEKLLYFPQMPAGSRTNFFDPERWGLTSWREVRITTEDGLRLQAWFFVHPHGKEAPTILFFHGNAGNISHRLDNVRGLFFDVGANVLIVSYRG